MKFHCLTSVELEPNNFTENEKVDQFKKYCLTCIEIGPNKQNLNVLNFQRENAEKISLLMKSGSVTIISIDWKVNGIIDLAFSNDANQPDNYCFVKSMRISNIKITKNTSLSEEEKLKYYDLTVKLNQAINNDAAAIKLIKETNFYNAPKSLRNRLQDIQKLIFAYCDPELQNVEKEIPEAAKYLPTTALKDEESVFIDKDNYHQRKRDNKIPWSKLTFSYVRMPRFDYIWFDTINLKELNLLNVEIADISEEAWTIFSSGIEKLQFLKKLVLNGNFDDLPDIVFQRLPVSLKTLVLYRVQNISQSIDRLINLKELSLVDNTAMTDLPWNALPESLMKLELIGTEIAEIPPNISKLINLESIIFTERYPSCNSIDSKEAYLREKRRFQDTKTVRISWESINKNIKFICASHVENLDELKYCNFVMLEEIIITDSRAEVNLHSKYLRKISLFNNHIFNFKWAYDFDLSCLDEVDLSSNFISGKCLEDFPFECITKPIAKLNLSKNSLTRFAFNKNVTNIKFLDLSWNHISTVTIDNGWDINEARDEMILNLAHNDIQFLPLGFEKLPVKEINLCHNLFSIKNIGNLDTDLWNRLPEDLKKLNISKNQLFSLPCMLQQLSLLKEVIAVDCDLYAICPWIFGSLLSDKRCYLDIRNNFNITELPFAPSRIFPHIQNLSKPIKCEKQMQDYEELSDIYDEIPTVTWTHYYDIEQSSKILINNMFLISTQQTKIIDLIFKLKHLPMWELCKCCAKCGDKTEDNPVVEQLMTMDYDLFEEKLKDEKLSCNYWLTKTWKTNLVTRFCEACIKQYKEEENQLKCKKRTVNDEPIFNSEAYPEMDSVEVVGTKYTEPQPCNSRTKIKKVNRCQQSIKQQSANDFAIFQNSFPISSPMEADSSHMSQCYNNVEEINQNQRLQKGIVPSILPKDRNQECIGSQNNQFSALINQQKRTLQQLSTGHFENCFSFYNQQFHIYNSPPANVGIKPTFINSMQNPTNASYVQTFDHPVYFKEQQNYYRQFPKPYQTYNIPGSLPNTFLLQPSQYGTELEQQDAEPPLSHIINSQRSLQQAARIFHRIKGENATFTNQEH